MVAPFEVRVDTLMSMRINASDIAHLFSNISTSPTTPDVISAVVFRYADMMVCSRFICCLQPETDSIL